MRIERPEQHNIDERAQRIFKCKLPDDWVPPAEIPDYRVDFQVRIFDKGIQTGIEFKVQLKGQRRTKRSRGKIRFRVETEDLAYWIDRCQHPLFLVVVDVTENAGWWLFVQRYGLYEALPTNWRKQRKVTLYIPEANTLADIPNLRSAVEEATRFMAGLRPASIEAAVDAQRRKMTSLDPRFDVQVKVDGEKIAFLFKSMQPVDVRLTIPDHADSAKGRVQEAYERGLQIELDSGEWQLSGSPIFESEEIANLKLDFGRALDASVQLSLLDSDGQELATLPEAQGTISGGPAEMRFLGSLPCCPFTISTVTDSRPNAGGKKASKLHMNFSPKNWANQPVRHLAYFEQLNKFFDVSASAASLRVRLFCRGNPIFDTLIDPNVIAFFGQVREMLALLSKAREIARQFNINPPCPAEFTGSEASDIEEIYWLLGKGEPPEHVRNWAITTQVMRSDVPKLASEVEHSVFGSLRLNFDAKDLNLFNTKLGMQDLMIIVDKAALVTTRAQMHHALSHSRGKTIPIEWRDVRFDVWSEAITARARTAITVMEVRPLSC